MDTAPPTRSASSLKWSRKGLAERVPNPAPTTAVGLQPDTLTWKYVQQPGKARLIL